MSSFCSQCGTGNSDLEGNSNLIAAEVDSSDIVPGTPKTIISETVAAGKILTLTSTQLTCRQPGKVVVEHTPDGGTVKKIASGRTGIGAKLNFEFKWLPFIPIAEAGKVEVIFTLHSWAAASDVEAYLQTTLGDA